MELDGRLRRRSEWIKKKPLAIVSEDLQLIQATLDGDSDAFGQLVSRYQDRLYHTITHVIGSAEDARDVVQDTFVQAFIKLDTFQHRSAFYTWLYRIAFNLAASRRRRQRPQMSVETLREADGQEPLDTAPRPPDEAQRHEQTAQLWNALDQLSDDHRSILVMREIDGLAYDEMAEILSLPVGTIRSRLFRARIQLRDTLKQTVGDES